MPSVSVRLDRDVGATVATPRVLVWDEDAEQAMAWGSELAAASAAPGRGAGWTDPPTARGTARLTSRPRSSR